VAYDRNRHNEYRGQLAGHYNEFDGFYKDSFSLMERINLGADPGNPIVVKGPKSSATDRTSDSKISVNELQPGGKTLRFKQPVAS
jgi:hypothetical protein